MKSKKIVFKLFVMTVSVFAIFLIFQVVFQSVFLEKFYLNSKIENTQKNINTFIESYQNNKWTRNEIMKNVNVFIEENNIAMSIVDKYGVPKYGKNAESILTIRSDSGELHQVSIDNLESLVYGENIDDLDDFADLENGLYDLIDEESSDYNEDIEFENNFKPKLGDKIQVKGILFLEDDFFEIYYLNHGGKIYEDTQFKSYYQLNKETNKQEQYNNELYNEETNKLTSKETNKETNELYNEDSNTGINDDESVEIYNKLYNEPYSEIFKDEVLGNYEDVIMTELDEDYEIKDISGEIIYIHYNEENMDPEFYKVDLLDQEIDSFFMDVEGLEYENQNEVKKQKFTNNGIDYYWFIDPNTNLKSIIFYKAIRVNGEIQYIFAMSSLQSIDEALNFISQYLLYMFVIAMILIFILSFFYSKMIAKPLINMNNAATKMAELDFSVKCDIQSNDELGSLSQSLNTLSHNLESSLTELRDTNSKLIDDIEREKQQELIRKEFVANVSHELKTPLGIMKGFAEGIKDGIFEDKKEYYLDVIIDEIEKMNVMIFDMLEISKLESKEYTLSKNVFEIDELLKKVKFRFDPMLNDNKLTATMDLKPYKVFGDSSKIEQVLMNLFSNAIRYSAENEKIKVSVIENNEKIRVSIINSGSYIAEEDISKIWDRFYRVEKSRNKSQGGTGLGLLIVKNILELHESEYGVRNTKDGVEFYFHLEKSC